MDNKHFIDNLFFAPDSKFQHLFSESPPQEHGSTDLFKLRRLHGPHYKSTIGHVQPLCQGGTHRQRTTLFRRLLRHFKRLVPMWARPMRGYFGLVLVQRPLVSDRHRCLWHDDIFQMGGPPT
jgi:hypothetical protein